MINASSNLRTPEHQVLPEIGGLPLNFLILPVQRFSIIPSNPTSFNISVDGSNFPNRNYVIAKNLSNHLLVLLYEIFFFTFFSIGWSSDKAQTFDSVIIFFLGQLTTTNGNHNCFISFYQGCKSRVRMIFGKKYLFIKTLTWQNI